MLLSVQNVAILKILFVMAFSDKCLMFYSHGKLVEPIILSGQQWYGGINHLKLLPGCNTTLEAGVEEHIGQANPSM